ncbi:MAG: tRNA pseudouridine(38-40) synthase TruA [Candidatus Alkaliphilus sp. MAG34]|nr:tRNA pseudouridine(38-40) synthase TruA [Clostridiales bacterium]
MRNIKIEIEYDGTNYCGWQIQQNGITIQGEITKALRELTGEEITIHGSGRTDAGAHAKNQVANFILENNIPTERLPLALNGILPGDITITNAAEVPVDFHARRSAIAKRYIYHIYESKYRSALLRNYSYHVHRKLNHSKMKEAAKMFIGTHDFRAFMASGSDVRGTVRTIYESDIVNKGKSLYIYIKGNGFLYNMVRIIVGTLVEIGLGKMQTDWIEQSFEIGDRAMAGHTAPPQGLFLDKVYYPADSL